jgi:hypothetical protein
VLTVLILTGCVNQLTDDTATITIHLNSGAGRAAYPPDDETWSRLIFIVDFSGPSAIPSIETEPGTRTINVSVPPGRYVITATAFLDGEVYAEGSASAQARAGHLTSVPLILYYAGSGVSDDTVINISAIEGVTAPVIGKTPVTVITENDQYSGIVTWSPNHSIFAASTAYTATITLTAKTGYTLYGVTTDFFTVAEASSVSNRASSRFVKVVFPSTAGTQTNPVTIDIAAIGGITAPVTGGTPVKAVTETAQYSGTVTWLPNHSTFAASTAYTATITLTAKKGYTLQKIVADFFTVAGASSVSNNANSGVVTAVFPSTAGTSTDPIKIDIAAIEGVTVPVTGGTPVTTITGNAQYSGTVVWSPSVSGTFAASTAYTATITLTAKEGYTLHEIAANFFTVAAATSVSNAANSGVVTAEFPKTYIETTINAAAIGVTAPVTGETPAKDIATDQYTGTIEWSPPVSTTFASQTLYTATITLTAKTDYTLLGVAANFFNVAGASAVSNDANSGVVTAVFPKTYTTIGMANITGVTAPKVGDNPVTSIESVQYTGTVTWSPDHPIFANFNTYTATITLEPKSGYTFQGVTANFFKVAGALSNNSANSGVITATFPMISYALGGTGPGGGKIFYYSAEGFTMTDTDEICHYLEAAPSGSGQLAWASSAYTSSNIAGTETAIGTGRKNTALILATDANAPAAKACKDLTAGGKTDWFFPSGDELGELYNNRFYVGNLGNANYYSSTQSSISSALFLMFQLEDLWRSESKDKALYVRAIRAF